MDTILLGRVTDTREECPLKAFSPIAVTGYPSMVAGMEMDAKPPLKPVMVALPSSSVV